MWCLQNNKYESMSISCIYVFAFQILISLHFVLSNYLVFIIIEDQFYYN